MNHQSLPGKKTTSPEEQVCQAETDALAEQPRHDNPVQYNGLHD